MTDVTETEFDIERHNDHLSTSKRNKENLLNRQLQKKREVRIVDKPSWGTMLKKA